MSMPNIFESYATGYHPVEEDDPGFKMEGGKVDRLGNPIFTLDQWRANPGSVPYVTVAMDASALPYGTELRSPDFPDVPFKVADTGSAFKGKGFSNIDIARDTAEGANHPENNGKFTFQIAGTPTESLAPVSTVTPQQGVMPDMSAISMAGSMPDITPEQSNIEGLGILAPIGEPGAQPIDTAPTPIPQVLPIHTKVTNSDGSVTVPETGTTWYKEGFMIKDVNGRQLKIDARGRQSWLPSSGSSPKDDMITAAARKGILRESFPDDESFTKAAQEALSFNTMKAGDIDEIAQSIVKGEQPPNLQGLYRQGASVRASLARQGYPLAQAQQDWEAQKKFLATLNGAQQLKLRQATEFVKETVPLVRELSSDLTAKIPRTQFPILNSAALIAARSGTLGQEAQISATKLTAQINDMQAELATMYRGGNTATDAALKQAGEMLKTNWTEPQLNAALDLVERNAQIRLNSIRSTGVAGVSGESYKPSGAEPEATPSPSSNFEEGKIYVDAQGRKAKWTNGQWQPVE